MDSYQEIYRQQIVYGRGTLWAPWYAVGYAARIRGEVPADLLRAVLPKLGILHPPLASRVSIEGDDAAWLTTEGVGDFPLEVRAKTSDEEWVDVFQQQERLPFAFGRGPVARFVLLHGERSSDIVALAPHVVCDGYSMAHVMFDLVSLLNAPEQAVVQPSPPPAVTWQNMSGTGKPNPLLRATVKALNGVWPRNRRALREDEYLELHRRYWMQYQTSALVFELAPPEMSDLAARCRRHHVTVTSALAAAFLLAQLDFEPAAASRDRSIGLAVNIRDRFSQPPGIATGIYSSSIDFKVHVGRGSRVWELADACHSRIHKALANHNRVLLPILANELKPSIVDAFCAAVCTDEWRPELSFLSRFMRVKGSTYDLGLSNIGRIELETGGTYPLDALFPWPPYMPGTALVLNTVTLNGRMVLILKFRQHELDDALAKRIGDRALEYLSAAP